MTKVHAMWTWYIPMLAHLVEILDDADVSVGWITEHLGPRSFDLVLFTMAIIAFAPVAFTFVGVLIA